MESRVNYMITGAFVLFFGAALTGFVFWMGKFGNDQKSYDLYKVYMDESVSGLNIESPVKLNGFEIGTVRGISIDRKNPDRIEVLLQVTEGTPLRADHVAILGSQGITGLKYIEISRDENAKNGGGALPMDSDGYRILPAGKSLLKKLEETADNLSEKIDATLARVNLLFSDDNLANIRETLAALKETGRQVNALLKRHGDKSLTELTRTAEEIRKLSRRFAMEIDRGSFDFKGITRESIDHINDVLTEMKRTLQETQTAVDDLRRSPSDILFKSQAVRYGPGERK